MSGDIRPLFIAWRLRGPCGRRAPRAVGIGAGAAARAHHQVIDRKRKNARRCARFFAVPRRRGNGRRRL